VSIVGVASVAADVAAVPRYQRGCLDALHRPSRHDLSALSTTIRYLPSCRGIPSLSAALVSSILDRRCALRISSSGGCPTHAALRSGTTKSVWCVCDRTHRAVLLWPIRCEGNGSRERRLMRSRVSLAELFHEIRVSIYESRSRRFLSLGIGRTFIIFRERIRIKVENKKKNLHDISHF